MNYMKKFTLSQMTYNVVVVNYYYMYIHIYFSSNYIIYFSLFISFIGLVGARQNIVAGCMTVTHNKSYS